MPGCFCDSWNPKISSSSEITKHLLQQQLFPSQSSFFFLIFLLFFCGFCRPAVASPLLHLLPLVALLLHSDCFWDPQRLKNSMRERRCFQSGSVSASSSGWLQRGGRGGGGDQQNCASVRPSVRHSADLSFGEFKPPDGTIEPRHELKPKCSRGI